MVRYLFGLRQRDLGDMHGLDRWAVLHPERYSDERERHELGRFKFRSGARHSNCACGCNASYGGAWSSTVDVVEFGRQRRTHHFLLLVGCMFGIG